MPSSPQHEPTMEEILASIRKIISEDSSEAAPAVEAKPAPAPAFAPAPAPAPAPVEADVLELTQEIQEEAPPPTYVPEPAAPPPENDVVFETIEEPAVTNEAALSVHDGIFSDKTRKAVEDTFANIEPVAEEPRRTAADRL